MTLAAWFTYQLDGPCLIESVGAFRDRFPDAVVAVADDLASPLTEETLSVIRPDLLTRTDFPRKGNLNGWPAIHGILQTLLSFCREAGADGVVKIDSDTLLVDDRWVDRSAPMCGFLSGRHAYLYGLAYWLRADAIPVIQAGLSSRWLEPGFPAPEDQCISTEAFRQFGSAILAHSWGAGMAANWQYTDGEFDRCAGRSVIHFGARRLAGGKCGSEQRERVALAMARFRAAATP